MDSEYRNTFLSCAELLSRQIQRSNEVCIALQQSLPHYPKRQQLILTQIFEKEKELSACIEYFLHRGPAHLLNTRLQYSSDENSSDNHTSESNSSGNSFAESDGISETNKIVGHAVTSQYHVTASESYSNQDYPNIITQLTAVNANISKQLEMAKQAMPDGSDDSFDAFYLKVNFLCRNISMIVLTMKDV